MRHLALMLVVLPALVACGTTTRNDSPFAKPNSLMEQEIANRVAQIPYLHREELIDNLLWLSQAGEQAFTHLIEGLSHQDPKVRSNCAWVLGRSGDRRVIPYLRKLVDDPAPTVQLEVARQLVQLGDVTQCPKLIEGLDSDKVQVRYLCHEALKEATGRDFGYDHLAENVADRRRAVLQWRQWWSRQSGDPWFAKAYAQRNGLESATAPEPAAPATEVKQPAPNAAPKTQRDSVPTTRGASPRGGSDEKSDKKTGTSHPSAKTVGNEGRRPPARDEVSAEEFEAILLGPEESTGKESKEREKAQPPVSEPAPPKSGAGAGRKDKEMPRETHETQETPAKTFRPVTPSRPTTGTGTPPSTTGGGH